MNLPFFARLGGAVCAALLSVSATAPAATQPAGFTEKALGSGWNGPVALAFDPSPARANRLYVLERAGRVWLVENGVKAPAPLLDLSDEVASWRDFGALGLALHPNFTQNGYLYLFYVVDHYHLLHAGTPGYDPAANEYFTATIGRITRYTVRAGDGFRSVDPASRKVLLGETARTGLPITSESHGTGALAFGTDGTLLAACGDGASFAEVDDGGPAVDTNAAQALAEGILQPPEAVGAFRAQLVNSLNGKILRLDPLTGDGLPSNPFYDPTAPRAARSRVWTLGLRNPYRFTVEPGSGDHDPARGDPGRLVIGDVGWTKWESLQVVNGPGVNCGWPLFEGLAANLSYQLSPAENRNAPNPLGGFFKFKDLIIQETLGLPTWPNPLNLLQQVPANLRFLHQRPVLQWGHTAVPPGPVQTGVFVGPLAASIDISAPGSPVSGPQFLGKSSTGGCFYTGTDFPASYQGTYFHADYNEHWIKNITFDANHRPTQVRDFSLGGSPVCVATHPSAGGLYYVDLKNNAVLQIVYAPGGNRPPTAVATASVNLGASPLRVQFSSAASSDPDAQALTYAWNFGDGTTSRLPNPAKIFTVTGTRRFDVVLTVTDSVGGTGQTTLPIFVNHTLPTVELLSPVNGAKYPLDSTVPYTLRRRVTELAGHPTTTRWDVALVHNDHFHPEPPILTPEGLAIITPIYSVDETYSYLITLTVTDDLGATVQKSARLLPNASNLPPQLAWSAPPQTAPASVTGRILDAAARLSDADSPGLEFGELLLTSSGGNAQDRLAILPLGNAPGQVSLAGADVLFSGSKVGLWNGGSAGDPLSIVWNEAATPAAAQAVLRRIAATFSGSGTRTVQATLDDGDGGISPVASLGFTIQGSALPGPWKAQDIGVVGLAGSAVAAGNRFTVRAAGTGQGGTADALGFVGLPWTGNGEIVARVVTLEPVLDATQAGVMFRESLAANARSVFVKLAAAQPAALQWRNGPGTALLQTAGPEVAAPHWVRLVRTGTVFTGSTSLDGVQWRQLGVVSVPMASTTIYAGLASASAQSDRLAEAVFDQAAVHALPAATPPLVALASPGPGALFKAPATVALEAVASDPDGAVAKVEFFNGSTKLGEDIVAPFTLPWKSVPAGSYALSVRATDRSALSTATAAVAVKVSATPTLPAPWLGRDFAPVSRAGSGVGNTGTFTLQASGAGFWGGSDAGYFVSQPWSGDGTLTVRVASLGNAGPAATGGLMFRASTAGNAPQVFLALTANQGTSLQWRSTVGGATSELPGPALLPPRWLQLTRVGHHFTASVSSNGSTWQLLGSTDLTLPTTALVGLALSASDDAALAVGVFDSLTLTAP